MAKKVTKPVQQDTPISATNHNTPDVLAREAAKFCVDFIDNWDKATKKRLNQIRDYELSYYGSVRPSLVGRSNVPFPVLAKYIDELKGRLDDFPTLKVENHRLAQLIVTRKVQAAVDILKKPTRGDWARNDRMGRNNAMFAGYGAVDFYTGRDEDGQFFASADPIDHNDFIFEPLMGSDLEKHAGVGRFPLFRSKHDLERMVEEGTYDANQVDLVVNKNESVDFVKNKRYFESRFDRYKAIGLDPAASTYIGQDVYAFAQLQITHPRNGKRYLVTLDYATGVWVRFEELKDVNGTNKYSIELWQTHEDPNVVMCKSPVDDIFPLAEMMRVRVNQLMDFGTKKIWGMKAVDPNYFPDPGELEWSRPDQIVVARAYQGNPIGNGVHEFQVTGSDAGSLDFLKYIDSFLAGVVGIDPSAVSEETQKVGVMFGQLSKVGARLGPLNKSYSEMWERGLQKIIYGMALNMTEPMMVQMLGSRGAEWDALKRSELGKPQDFEVIASSSNVENEMNEARKTHRQKALDSIKSDPDLKKEVNARWLVEEILRFGDFTDAEIRRGLDTKTYGREETLSRADQAIEEILKGKKPKLYHGADDSFFEYIYNYAMDYDGDEEKRVAIMQYGRAHLKIVVQNMVMRIAQEQMIRAADPNNQPDPNAKPDAPADTTTPAVIPKGPRKPSAGVVPNTSRAPVPKAPVPAGMSK